MGILQLFEKVVKQVFVFNSQLPTGLPSASGSPVIDTLPFFYNEQLTAIWICRLRRLNGANVFLISVVFTPSHPSHHGSVWLLPVISLLLTNAVFAGAGFAYP
jgi:hypothetical protein